MRATTSLLCATWLSLMSGWAQAQTIYRLTDLGTLGATNSYAYAINASGQVTGNFTPTGNAAGHAFLWNGTALQDLGTFGGTSSGGRAINASGQVTGYAAIAGNAAAHAFLWDGTAMQDLGTFGGWNTYGNAINASGQVAGTDTTPQNVEHAFLWDGTALQDLGTLGGANSEAYAINASGQVTGTSYTTGDAAWHAFLWDGTALQDLGTLGGTTSNGTAINASGQVTGYSYTTGTADAHAFLWDGTALQDLGTLGGTFSNGTAINASGQVTGGAGTIDNSGSHAFLWDGTAMQDLGTLGGSGSLGLAINASGQVTGMSKTTADVAEHAFLWDGTVMHDLNALIDPADPLQPFVTLTKGVDINDHGQIAANDCNVYTLECHAYLVSPVTVGDTTPPAIQSSVSGTLGNGGWYVSNVQVAWTVTDPESAISTSTGCDPITVAVDTAGTTFTCSAASAGGSSTASVTVKRDATAPNAKASAKPPANRYGWRDENVTVRFSGSDAMSRGVTCDPQAVLSTDGLNQSVSGRCYDAAGNQSSLATASGINIDKTDPTASIASPTNGATYNRSQIVLANFTCGDALSGIATCRGTVAFGRRIDTSEKTKYGKFTVTATDKAGNETTKTVTYSVK